jgi:type II secretory pathway pseudopilin PulG
LRRYGGRRRGGEGGFTLMEVLIALGAMSLALGLGAVAFSDVVRLRGAEDRYQQRLASVDFLLRRIARDVRPGRAFLARAELSGATSGKAEKFAAGADTMIVSTGTGIVVYRAAAGKVERIEVRKDRTERGLVLDAPGVRVAFDLEGAPAASARSVVTTAEWTEPASIGVSRPTLSLRVALRNPNRTVDEP